MMRFAICSKNWAFPLLVPLAMGAALLVCGSAADRKPTSLAEVARRAEALGFHCTHGQGPTGASLMVSLEWIENPQSNPFRYRDVGHYLNIGRLLVRDPMTSGFRIHDPPSLDSWGRLHVHGDPDMVRKIAEQR